MDERPTSGCRLVEEEKGQEKEERDRRGAAMFQNLSTDQLRSRFSRQGRTFLIAVLYHPNADLSVHALMCISLIISPLSIGGPSINCPARRPPMGLTVLKAWDDTMTD